MARHRLVFEGRAHLGKSIDAAVKAGNAKRAVSLMRQSEIRLTLKRRRIGGALRAASTTADREKREAEMDEINAVMADLCFHIRDPHGYAAKNRVHW